MVTGPRVTLALLLGRSDRPTSRALMWRALAAEATERGDPDVVGACSFARPGWRGVRRMGHGYAHSATRLWKSLTRRSAFEVFEPLCLIVMAEIDAYRGDEKREDDPRLVGIAPSTVQYAGSPFACG